MWCLVTVDAWGGFSSQGKTELSFHEGTLDAPAYQDILQKKLPAAQGVVSRRKEGWELQQDKATCHTAKSTTDWLEQLEVGVVEGWSTKGNDVNPIENLWTILDERFEDKKFKTEEGMKKAICQVWNEVDLFLLHNLIHSIPDRLRTIRKAKGGSIQAVK